MAVFSQYAAAAAEEALKDSGWRPESDEEQERTVRSLSHRLPMREHETRETDAWNTGCMHRIWYR